MTTKKTKEIEVVTLSLGSVAVLLLGSYIVDHNLYDLIFFIVTIVFMINYWFIKAKRSNKS